MLTKIRNYRSVRVLTLVLSIQVLYPLFSGNVLFAQDGAPTQPEIQSFEPIGTNQMVDLFTGDFTYNIPLFNIPGPDGGYPINLAYHSGVQMEQEASWVGLGWNINVGTINRQVRNLPDDFGGTNGAGEDQITIKTDMKANWTAGIGLKIDQPEILGLPLGISLGNPSLRIYYNNYKGFGYTFGLGLSLGFGIGNTGLQGSLGYNLSLDSQDGIGQDVTLSPYVGLKPNSGMSLNATVGTGFNTRTGWKRNLVLGLGASADKLMFKDDVTGARYYDSKNSQGYGSPLSISNPAVSASVPYQMRGENYAVSFTTGLNLFGFFTKGTITVDFSRSELKDRNENVYYNGIGYMYYQNASDDYKDVKDVSRENDGLIHKDTRRLGTPTQTYDIYSVTGQGIGNSFRPYRTDISTIEQQHVKSEYYGGNFGLEMAINQTPANLRAGLDVGFNYSYTKVDDWPADNTNALNLAALTTRPSISESVYFQNYGEHSVDNITSEYGSSVSSQQAVAYALENDEGFYNILNKDANNGNTAISLNTSRSNRKRRAMGVEAFTNEQILNADGYGTVISEFEVEYYNGFPMNQDANNLANLQNYDPSRQGRTKTHVGGYVATNAEGMRYVYGIAAYNNDEKDVAFTVAEDGTMADETVIDLTLNGGEIDYEQPGTNQFYQSRSKTGYAHSYLLTSILGTDYADIDGIPGPSEGDLGYWVKFNYRKVWDGLPWRSPLEGAAYDRGYERSFTDGTGRYSYGSKEVWYLASIETKTHVAEFHIQDRKDGSFPVSELDGGVASGGYQMLEHIDVFSKAERYPNGTYNSTAKPIKSCHFVYDYSLCPGIETNDGSGTYHPNEIDNDDQGRLTLKKFYFTHHGNSIGATTPYEFEYYTDVAGQTVQYDREAVDRWGVYQPNPVSGATNVEYPYNDPYTDAMTMKERAQLWSISAINLPSGGRFEIDYEADSYGYVQDEVAMHMYKIISMDDYDTYQTNGYYANRIDHDKDALGTERRIYFELEEPISTSDPDINGKMLKYIRPGDYMYFKVAINVTETEDVTELVGGYSKVASVNVDPTSAVGGQYLWGYVELEFMKIDGKQTHFHPFTEVGARHIKFNHPDILYDANAVSYANSDDLSKSDIKNVGNSIFSNSTDFKDLFSDFTRVLTGVSNNKRLSHVDLQRSWIRLRTPDKIKYGGGHRVKEVRIVDNWADAFLTPGTENSSTYGTVYEYDLKDENGNIIGSSGVAAYEPIIGGDEIALRKPIKGWEDKNLASKNEAQTYTEEPGNESLFPAPRVGYSQVRVMSLNTSDRLNGDMSIVNYTGVTVNEFYTAKDYPVMRNVSELEQNKTFRKSRLIVPALIVNIDRLRMAATQGYYIELNDMHGKPKGGKEIGFSDQGDEIEISSVQYDYFDSEYSTWNDAGEQLLTRRLNNTVDVLYADVDPNDETKSLITPATLATDVEFVPEVRYHESKSISGGLRMNFETFGIIPAFVPVPFFNWSKQRTGSVVTNKIVSKAGILKKTTAVQRGSKVETENLAFDQYTGQPLLTTVNNDYGDLVYGYSIKAYDAYDGVGPSYKNIGVLANGTAVNGTFSNGTQEVTVSGSPDFVPGDELLATPVIGSTVDPTRDKQVCVVIQKQSNGNYLMETSSVLSNGYQFMVIRSGRRNLLTASVSSITALENPTENRLVETCVDGREGSSLSFSQRSIDEVLSISALELGDKWYKNTREISDVPGSWFDNAFYSKGMSGVYSGVRNYTYVDNRTQTENAGVTEVDLQNDGVMNDVALFDWDYILSTKSGCPTKWVEVNQVTLKNPSSSDVEMKNILGTYSASLYGKSGTEPIATAGNARNSEIGFESFEEYSNGSLSISDNATNNMNFYTTIDIQGRKVEDRFDVRDGFNNYAYIDVDYSVFTGYSDLTLRIHFDGFDSESEERLVRLDASALAGAGSGMTSVNIASVYASLDVTDYDKRRWRGELFATKSIPDYPASLTNPNVVITDDVAHTGKKAIRVSHLAGSDFLQGRLTLKEGEKYQLSGWFSSPENIFLLKNYETLFYSKMKLEFFDVNGTLVSTQEFNENDILVGSFIEDWQKFRINFTLPAGAHYVSVKLPVAHEVYDNEIQDYVQAAYYDDLRIQPLDGGMQAFVFNQENQRLEASLDANNYATFYYYNDEGNLFLVKRETKEGIITVQESRSYLKRN